MTDYEKWEYEIQNYCHLCKKSFVMIKIIKANMKYIAKLEIIATTPENCAAHNICNLRYRE